MLYNRHFIPALLTFYLSLKYGDSDQEIKKNKIEGTRGTWSSAICPPVLLTLV
jgi:hypothetical protein